MDMERPQAAMFPLLVRVDMDEKRNQIGPGVLVWHCRLGPDIEHVAAHLDAFIRECIQVVLEVPYHYGIWSEAPLFDRCGGTSYPFLAQNC